MLGEFFTMKQSTVDVIKVFPGEEIDGVSVANNFSAFQMVASEKIKLLGLPKNIRLLPEREGIKGYIKTNLLLMKNEKCYVMINDNAYFVSVDKHGDVISITDKETEIILDWIIDAKHIKVIQ